MMEPSYYEDNEGSYTVTQYYGVKHIEGPHETIVVIKNNFKEVDYFDTELILHILLDEDSTMNEISGCYTFNSIIKGVSYKLTINPVSGYLEIINTDVNITNNFGEHNIPTTDYPIYQYTNNKCIIMLTIILIICYMEEFNITSYKLLENVEKLSEKINPKIDYYLDEISILILSIYAEIKWVSQIKLLSIINEKIESLGSELENLQLKKTSSGNQYVYEPNREYVSIKTKMKHLKIDIKKYIKLENVFNSLKDTDEILEVMMGCNTYFMVKRNNIIMTLKPNEYNTIECKPIDSLVLSVYSKVNKKLNDMVNNSSYNMFDSSSYNMLPYIS